MAVALKQVFWRVMLDKVNLPGPQNFASAVLDPTATLTLDIKNGMSPGQCNIYEGMQIF